MSVIQVVDANGALQQVCVQSPTTPLDRSGTIVATNVSQILMDAMASGSTRGGWIVQNNGTSGGTLQINDTGNPADQSPSSIYLAPGEFFPPPGYPVTQGEITIAGTIGDNFMAREW